MPEPYLVWCTNFNLGFSLTKCQPFKFRPIIITCCSSLHDYYSWIVAVAGQDTGNCGQLTFSK